MTNRNVYDVIDRIAADDCEQNLETGLKTASKQLRNCLFIEVCPCKRNPILVRHQWGY